MIREGLVQCLPGADISPVEALSAGWETDVYGFTADGQPLVLRVYSGGDIWARATAEGRAMQLLHGLGYPVPRVVTYSEDCERFGGSYLIMERIRVEADRRSVYLQEFCSLLHRLHSLDTRAFGLETPSSFAIPIVRMLAGDLETAFEPVYALLEQRAPLVGWERRCLTHGDFHHENILMGPGDKPYVIDWSCAALDDPRVDVAQAMVLAITNGSPGFAEQVRLGYEALAGGPLPHLDFFVLVALARRVTTMAVTMVRGSAALGLRPGLEGQLRQEAPRMLQALGLLEQMSGVPLPRVRSAMEQASLLG